MEVPPQTRNMVHIWFYGTIIVLYNIISLINDHRVDIFANIYFSCTKTHSCNCVAHVTWHTFWSLVFSYLHLIIILVLFFFHILLSIHLHRSFNSCVSVLPRASLGYINRRNWAKRFIHRRASTLTTLLSKTSPAPQDLSAPPPAALEDPYERILLLEVLDRHQELLHCSWITHAQSTAAVPVPSCSCPPRGPQL